MQKDQFTHPLGKAPQEVESDVSAHAVAHQIDAVDVLSIEQMDQAVCIGVDGCIGWKCCCGSVSR